MVMADDHVLHASVVKNARQVGRAVAAMVAMLQAAIAAIIEGIVISGRQINHHRTVTHDHFGITIPSKRHAGPQGGQQ